MSDATADVLVIARHRLQELRRGAKALPADRPDAGQRQRDACAKSEISAGSHELLRVVAETTAMGEAGPGIPAWRGRVDRGTRHVRAIRDDGSAFCATCHPGTVARGTRLT